jgi:hypothetical protein
MTDRSFKLRLLVFDESIWSRQHMFGVITTAHDLLMMISNSMRRLLLILTSHRVIVMPDLLHAVG